MHKAFYASGFLYNPSTYQILLQQLTPVSPTSSSWSMFEAEYLENEQPETVLKNLISELLSIEVGTVHHVYSYENESKSRSQFVGYSKVRSRKKFTPKNGYSFEWFSFNEIAKINVSSQMKHDIVVGQRVIEAALRKHRGQHTL